MVIKRRQLFHLYAELARVADVQGKVNGRKNAMKGHYNYENA